MDGKAIYSYRLGRRSAQKVLDASPYELQLRPRPRPLPRVGYEKDICLFRDGTTAHRVVLANVAGRFVLRCATSPGKHWPREMLPAGVRMRAASWEGQLVRQED